MEGEFVQELSSYVGSVAFMAALSYSIYLYHIY